MFVVASVPEMVSDISFEDYCGLPGLNASTLAWGMKYAQHLKACLDGELKKESPALTFGRALHAKLLEPDVYLRDFTISTGCQAIIKSGDSKGMVCGNNAGWLLNGQWLCGLHAPKALKEISKPETNCLTMAEAERVELAAASVMRHKVVGLLRQRGGFEVTLRYELDGIKCKARLDKYIPATSGLPPIVIDLKKVAAGKAGSDSFAKSIVDYDYCFKAAWYVDAVHAVVGVKPTFIWVVVEDEAPYGVNVIQADGSDLAIGRMQYRDCMAKYIHGMRTGEWPGYAQRIQVGGAPEWYKKRFAL